MSGVPPITSRIDSIASGGGIGSLLEVLEQGVELRLGAHHRVVLGGKIAVLEVEVRAEVRLGALPDEGGLRLAALVVDVGIPVPAVLADVQVGAAMGTGVSTADLDAD